MPNFRNWYHCTAHTYGSWLPGDQRGFRTRHHQQHIEGDYNNPPPPGMHDERLVHSRCETIRDERHLRDTIQYIVRHDREGGACWEKAMQAGVHT